MTCLHPYCPEPEAETPWCAPHQSLIPGKLLTRYRFTLRKVQTCPKGETKRFQEWHNAFLQAREDCREAIHEELERRKYA